MSKLILFMAQLKQHYPVFAKEFIKTQVEHTEAFDKLGELLLSWAEKFLGENTNSYLIEGYCQFVLDVNRSQIIYEKEEKYKSKSYSEVYLNTYDNDEFMEKYHWGVYTTTFAWGHHIKLYNYFEREFLSIIGKSGHLLDLGAGSGIWHLLLLENCSEWKITAVDISDFSVKTMKKHAELLKLEAITHLKSDALTVSINELADAAISCFLLEHLEEPDKLLKNLFNNLKSGGYAFITGALTAAEIDHIYEFRKESELILMAESAGFRVISCFSSAPENYDINRKYLPRSMALVLQKRHGEFW